MKRFPSPLILVVIMSAGLWLYGFLLFVSQIDMQSEPRIEPGLEKTDAIVVLTGGSERVTTGIDLLEAGYAKKLLISGVYKGLTLENIFSSRHVSPDLRACCIVLGYQAGSTMGNAEETRLWMENEKFTSLRLVTANYHMPRSLLLFHTAMPDMTIFPHPVAPDSVKLVDWWQHPGTIELLATEYNKLLLANVKLWINQE